MARYWLIAAPTLRPPRGIEELKGWLLAVRQVDESSEADWFRPRWEKEIHDPNLLAGVPLAIERISRAMANEEEIMIYGDYDVDGVSSTAIMCDTLQRLGARVTPFLPHRIENGYGLDGVVLERLAETVSLIITVDCGLSNWQEIARLQARGVDVIVTDHHQLPAQLPPAITIIHPALPAGAYPWPYLSGAGVSWKLAQALIRHNTLFSPIEKERWEKELLDLACLGTIADVVPVKGENRAIISFGLSMLSRSGRPGIRAAISTQGREVKIDEELVSFRLVPLLNAAGRLDHPQLALDLLLASTEIEAGRSLAALQQLNRQRQLISQRIQKEAEAAVELAEPIVFAHNQNWPPGVVGLVAGRLSEKYTRPAFVLGGGLRGATGSARAPGGSNLVGMLKACESTLIKYGGHDAAAGFSVAEENVLLLKARLRETVKQPLSYDREVKADAIVNENSLNWEAVDLINKMAPFGAENEKPRFVAKEVYLANWRLVGKTGEHVKFTFKIGERLMEGIGFRLAEVMQREEVGQGEMVEVMFLLEADYYGGRARLQLRVIDIAKAGKVMIKQVIGK